MSEKKREVRPWDLITPNSDRATEEKAEQRFSLCLECPELIKFTKQCKKCGCFMVLKTRLELASCPIGKW